MASITISPWANDGNFNISSVLTPSNPIGETWDNPSSVSESLTLNEGDVLLLALRGISPFLAMSQSVYLYGIGITHSDIDWDLFTSQGQSSSLLYRGDYADGGLVEINFSDTNFDYQEAYLKVGIKEDQATEGLELLNIKISNALVTVPILDTSTAPTTTSGNGTQAVVEEDTSTAPSSQTDSESSASVIETNTSWATTELPRVSRSLGAGDNEAALNDDQSESVYGGAGFDKVFVGKSINRYELEKDGQNIFLRSKDSNTSDLLLDVERISFSDKAIAFDADGVAGQAYRIYKAAFDRIPDSGGLGYWISQMDDSMDMVEVAARFIDSDEFRSLYGTNPTNGEFLNKVYLNVLDRLPDESGYAWWIDQLENNPEKTWQKVLADFSESAENQSNVADLIANGIVFDPWVG